MASRRSGDATTLRLATFLPYRLNVVAAVVSEGLARRYQAQFGIAVPEWRVLATLGEFGRMNAGAIGQHARMNKVKVSRAALALESRGLIVRTTNAEDRREAFLTLTPGGRDVYDRIAPLALAYAANLVTALPPDDAAALDRILDSLLATAGRMEAEPEEPSDAALNTSRGPPRGRTRRPS